MAERLRSDRLGRYVTHYDGNDYISCCSCVRSGRKSECRCGEDQEELDWTWDLSSTSSDTKLQVGIDERLNYVNRTDLGKCIHLYDVTQAIQQTIFLLHAAIFILFFFYCCQF